MPSSRADTASQELRPLWHGRNRIGPLGEESPERRMVPTQLLSGRVAVGADSLAQTSDLGDQGVARETNEVLVHANLQSNVLSA